MLDAPAALALLAALFFGLGLVLSQRGLAHLPPAAGARLSVPAATALLWMIAPITVDWRAASLAAAALFAAIGLLFPATVTLLTFESNRRMGPGVAGALGNLAPFFAVLGAVLLLGEALRPAQALGLAIILAGAALLSLDRHWAGRAWPLAALALPLAAAAIRGLVQPVTRLGLELWREPVAAALIGYSVSSLVLLTLVRAPPASPGAGSRAGRAWFVAAGLANGAAVLTLYAALARGPVGLVAPLVATYPVATLAIGAVLLRTGRPPPMLLGGVALTVAGVAILIRG